MQLLVPLPVSHTILVGRVYALHNPVARMEGQNKVLTDCLKENNTEKILELLRLGLDPNLDGGWPIRLAARHGSLDVVKTLLQFGANPHDVSKAGKSYVQIKFLNS